MLAHADYPDVLVAGAVSDGDDLKLHLASGIGDGEYTIQLGRLKPGTGYRIADTDPVAFVAGADGGASLRVALGADVRSVHIVPVG